MIGFQFFKLKFPQPTVDTTQKLIGLTIGQCYLQDKLPVIEAYARIFFCLLYYNLINLGC